MCAGAGLFFAAQGAHAQIVVFPGDDAWMTPRAHGVHEGSLLDFANSPIPAGFFGPGSDPFQGRVEFCGEPLESTLGTLGTIDTIVRRPSPTVPLSPPAGMDTVPIEIVALSLVSCQPITVTYNAGTSFELWNVSAALSQFAPQTPG